MGILFDIRQEKFCQFVASGMLPGEAKVAACLPKKWGLRKLLNTPPTSDRIQELLEGAAKRAEMSRKDIITGVQEEWKLARLASQHSAALRAAEMLGMELHGMFRKQVEVGRPGEFDGMDADQLKEYILQQLKELGLSPDDIPKIIDSNGAKEINKLTENSGMTKMVTSKQEDQ